MDLDVAKYCIDKTRSVHEAIACLDRTRMGIVLVVEGNRRLVGTVTDGDVRRAVLAGIDLSLPVETLLQRKANSQFARPITSSMDGAERSAYLKLLKKYRIHHLPLVDREGCVTGLVTMDEFLPDRVLPLQTIIMAGGKGHRLRPLTQHAPKPMLSVGGRPLLETIIQQLREAGILKVKVTTHHLSKQIENYFGDGRHFGMDLTVVDEEQPMGTVGGLGLLEPPKETTLVINGDILTQVDYRAMLAYHREHQADLTVAVRLYEFQIPYGVVECDGPAVTRLSEKPTVGWFINAGMYLLEPGVYRLIPRGQKFDMTDLIQQLIGQGRPVVSFPIRENWMDIGRHADYAQAQESIRKWGIVP